MKFLKTIILILLISFNLSAFAESDEEFTPAEEQITLQDASKDFSNKVIISLFGYKTFSTMLDKELISNNLSIYEIENAVAPLPYLFPKLIYVYQVISFITIFVFIVYLSYILYESFVKTQNSGAFLGQGNNTTFFIIKIFLTIALIFPISNNSEEHMEKEHTTVVQMLVLKTFSFSNEMGKEITNSYIRSQPKLYPEIKYIGNNSLDNHEDIGIYMLEYHMCLKRNNLKPKYKFYKDNRKLIIENTAIEEKFSDQKCKLNISYPLDYTNKDIINNKEELSVILNAMYPLNEEYLTEKEKTDVSDPEKNIETYKRYETSIISSYVDFNIEINRKAEKIANVILSKTNDNKNSTYTVSDLKDLLFNNNLIPSNDWYKHCNQIINYPNSDNNMTIEEKQYYTIYASKCLSHEITKKITYKNITDFQNYLSEDNYLNNNHINLCTHDFNSENGKVKNIKFNYEIENPLLETTNSEPILNCISNECSYIDTNLSNIYTCSSAISLYSSYNNERKMSNIGFISIAPIMYRSFVNYSNVNSRKLFNDIKIESPSVLENLERLNEIKINDYGIVENSSAELEYKKIFFNSRNITNMYIFDNDSDIQSYNFNRQTYNEIITSNNKVNKEKDVDENPLDRLKNCIEKPNQINKGYVCGSVPQEYNTFGSKLVGIYSAAVLLRSVYQGFKEDLSEDLSGVAETKRQKNRKLRNSRFREKTKNIVASVAGLAAVYAFADMDNILYIMGLNNNNSETTTDAFSTYSNDVNNFQENLINNPSLESLPSLSETGVITSLILIYSILPEEIFEKIKFFYSFLLLIGIFIGFVVPLIPYWLFLSILLSYFSLLLVRIVILPILSIFIMEPSQTHESNALKNIIIMFSEVLFKIPLMIIGIILSWIMTNNIISKVFILFDIESILSMQDPAWYANFLIFIVAAIIYVVLLFILTNLTMTIIQTFYDFSTDWFKGQSKNIIGNSKDQQNMSKTKQFLNLKTNNKK